MDFDKNSDLKLDKTELAEVSQTIFTSLAEYNYFQFVSVKGKDVVMKPPGKFAASFDGDQLIVRFESEPAKPLKLSGKIDFGIYDPSFYTAIDFTDDNKMEVKPMPANCTRTVIRPDAQTAIAQNQQSLTASFFNDPTGTNLSKIFATKLELDCKAKG
jgi:ABC-type uncharacterized transport system substrate-binding protein